MKKSGVIAAVLVLFALASYALATRFLHRGSDSYPVIYRDDSALLGHENWASHVDTFTASGVCIIDADSDGRDDLFLPGPGYQNVNPGFLPEGHRRGNALFMNRSKNGKTAFEEVTDSTIRGFGRIGIGCAVADFDNDGDQDIVVTNATKGVGYSAYGELSGDGSQLRIFPPEDIFMTDGTDGRHTEGGITLLRNDGAQAGVPRFTDISEIAGLTKRGNMTAAAWGDVDRDGFVDLFIGSYVDFDFLGFSYTSFAGGFDSLYRNNGDGTFTDMSERAGMRGSAEFVYDSGGERQFGWRADRKDAKGTVVGEPAGNTLAASFFDYNDDMLPDLVIASDIPGRIRLYRNEGNFTFSEHSEENGMGLSGAWMGLAIGDLDGDAGLDLFATNFGGPMGSRYRRLKEDETHMFNIFNPPNRGTYYQNLWLNGTSTLRLATKETVVNWNGFEPDVRWYPPGTTDNPSFASPRPEGIEKGEFGFGAAMFDHENDGDMDLAWIGSLGRAALEDVNRGNPGRLLRNDGGLRFTDIAREVGAGDMRDQNDWDSFQNGRGLAVADFNDDGYLDLVYTNNGGWDEPAITHRPLKLGFQYRYLGILTGPSPGPTILLTAVPKTNNNWLKVKLQGDRSNRLGIGAKIAIEYEEAGQTKKQVREVIAGSSYASQHSLVQHFGIGQADRVKSLTIRWPSGGLQTLENIKTQQTITILEQ